MRAIFTTGLLMTGGVALATFVTLNPFLYSHPKRPIKIPLLAPVDPDESPYLRLHEVIAHRVGVSNNSQGKFPHNALNTPREKLQALAVQGFGRFGPFGPRSSDSTIRFDWRQDFGAILWGPWVAAGLVWTMISGRWQQRRGELPTRWLLGLQFVVAMATVGSFLPMAWDRYFLPIQSASVLLASGVALAAFDLVFRRTRRA